MPSTNPFSIEYIVGGLQFITILFLLYVIHLQITLNLGEFNILSGAAAISSILSFAYPTGIVIDNIAAYIGNQNNTIARKNYNILLKNNPEFLMKRIVEFQTAKRILRSTLCNSIIFFIGYLVILLSGTRLEPKGTLIVLFTNLAVIFLVHSTLTYLNKNYINYLTEIATE